MLAELPQTEDGATHRAVPGAGLAPAQPPADGRERRFSLPAIAAGGAHPAVGGGV
jgi:hypothetical protein